MRFTIRHVPLTLILFAILILAACQVPTGLPPTPEPIQNIPTSAPLTLEPPTPTQATPAPTPTDTATPAPSPCLDLFGQILTVDIPTDKLNHPVNTKIYLPPCYDQKAAGGYPVLLMLHGQAASNTEWIELGLTDKADELISAKTIQPMIIVMPFEVTWTPGPDESKFDEALIQDVLPYIDANYNACGQRSCRAVGGLSRGGNWAVYLGFAYPDLFSVIGAHSTPLFYGELARISQVASTAASSADLPWVIVDVGDHDEQHDKVMEFVAALKNAGVHYDFYEFTGYHDATYWSAHVGDYLRWYSERLILPPVE